MSNEDMRMPVENPASLKVDNEKLRGLLTRCDEYTTTQVSAALAALGYTEHLE